MSDYDNRNSSKYACLEAQVMREVAWIIYDEFTICVIKKEAWCGRRASFCCLIMCACAAAAIPNSRILCLGIEFVTSPVARYIWSRPTPLEHFLYPAGASGLYLVVDRKDTLETTHFKKR